MENTTTVPQKAYDKFTSVEKAQFPIVKIKWKHEGGQGPVFVQFEAKQESIFGGMSNVGRNYSDGQPKPDGKFFPKWFGYSEAKEIAKSLKVEFEEI